MASAQCMHDPRPPPSDIPYVPVRRARPTRLPDPCTGFLPKIKGVSCRRLKPRLWSAKSACADCRSAGGRRLCGLARAGGGGPGCRICLRACPARSRSPTSRLGARPRGPAPAGEGRLCNCRVSPRASPPTERIPIAASLTSAAPQCALEVAHARSSQSRMVARHRRQLDGQRPNRRGVCRPPWRGSKVAVVVARPVAARGYIAS